MLNVDTYTRKLSTIADSAGFNQIVANPTRCTDTSQTLIDLIFTNIHRLQEDARNIPSFTDHEIISTSIPAKIENRPDIILKRNLTAQNIYKINIKLVQCDWKYSCEDIEALYTNFINNINKCVDDIAPLVEHHNHTKQWIDGEVKAAQKERDIHYKTFRYTNKKEDYVKYKQSRNKVVSLLRKKEKQHYEDKIDICRNDSKKMWKTLKELSREKKDSFKEVHKKHYNAKKEIYGSRDTRVVYRVDEVFGTACLEQAAEQKNVPCSHVAEKVRKTSECLVPEELTENALLRTLVKELQSKNQILEENGQRLREKLKNFQDKLEIYENKKNKNSPRETASETFTITENDQKSATPINKIVTAKSSFQTRKRYIVSSILIYVNFIQFKIYVYLVCAERYNKVKCKIAGDSHLNNIPSVIYFIIVSGLVQSSKRMVYPTSWPNLHPNSSATRLATDMAATRLGCVQPIFPLAVNPASARKRINAPEQKREELVHLAHTALSSNDANPDPEDEYLIAGKRIGYQLKAIEGQQKIIAEKLISDVIFYANMGKLTEHCSINVPSSSSTTHVSCPTNQKPHDSVQNSGFQSIEIGDGTYTTLTSQPSQVLNRESNSHVSNFFAAYRAEEYQ
nr:unnamed protein product [Callosobruchus analis]